MSSADSLVALMEPEVRKFEAFDARRLRNLALCSIAISLKRLADHQTDPALLGEKISTAIETGFFYASNRSPKP